MFLFIFGPPEILDFFLKTIYEQGTLLLELLP